MRGEIPPIPPPEGAVLRFFRFSLGRLTEEVFGQKADVSAQAVGRWESGSEHLSRNRLGELLAPWQVPPEAIDAALFAHRLAYPPPEPVSPVEPPEEDRRLIDQAAAAGGWSGAQTARAELTLDGRRRQARGHRLWAAERWSRMARLPPQLQEDTVEMLLGDDRSWALAEKLCLASEKAAADRASEALRLARLAVRLAEQCPGPESWRLRLCGWCEPFLANALRVGGDFTAAGGTFASADELWERGATGDPAGLLDGTRRLDLKASLFMYQEEHREEARSLLDEALRGASTDQARGRLLIKKANALVLAGEYEASLEVLEQGEPRIDEQSEPRLLFLHRFTRATNLIHLDRYEAAEPLIPLVEALAADLGNELDRVRTCWLRGRCWAGLGRWEEALAALSEVRRYFQAEEIAYDFALVSLEVAELHLKQGKTSLVQVIAEEMLWIFKTQKVHKEALAALALFCRAAREEEAEAEWIRGLIKYLYRAQHNPSLRFEP
jgi:tetratricopeptide (TPR) repeat protein/transcriptional regulator with XRE-family HTH domain